MASKLFRRDDTDSLDSTIIYNLLVALVVLSVASLLLTGSLLLLRRRRMQMHAAAAATVLPVYNEKRGSTSSTHSYHRRAAARSISPMQFQSEKEMYFDTDRDSRSTVESIPEIRVTFPEEIDETGKLQSGKVVVVRVNDSGIGLENVPESMSSHPPSYSDDFQSVDLDRVGGLVEKPRKVSGWD